MDATCRIYTLVIHRVDALYNREGTWFPVLWYSMQSFHCRAGAQSPLASLTVVDNLSSSYLPLASRKEGA
jgi:hypothetical protein